MKKPDLKSLKNFFHRNRPYETGLVLSGGGARGFAHAGILKAMHEADIHPDIISGVSAGAIVGALYADGYTPDEIHEIFRKGSSFFNYVRITMPRTGMFKAVGLRESLQKYLKAKSFEDLDRPLFVAATNMNRGKIVYFNSGALLDAVMASAAIPVLLEPINIAGDWYSDGGILDNFPVAPIQKKCKRLIGISLNPVREEYDLKGLMKMAERTYRLSVSSHIGPKIAACDMVFEPGEMGQFGLLDASKGQEMFELGYRVAHDKLQK